MTTVLSFLDLVEYLASEKLDARHKLTTGVSIITSTFIAVFSDVERLFE